MHLFASVTLCLYIYTVVRWPALVSNCLHTDCLSNLQPTTTSEAEMNVSRSRKGRRVTKSAEIDFSDPYNRVLFTVLFKNVVKPSDQK